MLLVFCDLDMTLIDTKELITSAGPEPLPYGSAEHQAWVETVTDAQKTSEAKPIEAVKDLVLSLIPFPRTVVIFLTSRRMKDGPLIQNWLLNQGFGGYSLVMRLPDDFRSSGEYKIDCALKIQAHYENSKSLFIDDDPDGSLETECKKYGITLLKTVY
jgi:hypothetical protein